MRLTTNWDRLAALSLGTLCVLLVMIVAAPRGDVRQPDPTHTDHPQPAVSSSATARAEFLAYLRAQPEIKDALYTEVDWLYLGVANNGTDWTSYAAMTCRMLRGRGITDVVAVKMVDIAQVRAGNGFKQLGRAWCD